VKQNRRSIKVMAAVWLVTYVICIGLVCSFILFEVLDVDGSDFPSAPSTAATPIKLAEPPHEIKRALLAPPQFWALLPVVIILVESAGLMRLGTPVLAPSQPGPRGRRGLRIWLPRASLADAAPSA
jgi:hypothetical protein